MTAKKGIIFDMDGVLIDAMPFHAEAMSRAIKEMTNHDIDKKILYLLEGMPSSDLVKEVFRREHIDDKGRKDDNLAKQVGSRKEQIFNQIQNAKGIDGAKEIIEDLTTDCGKACIIAVVSGAAREEVETILYNDIATKYFDFIITGDDLEKGKPNPAPFLIALKKMNLPTSHVIVVENSPLGVKAANKAGLECVITLNNTPLDIHNDFKGVMSSDPKKYIFNDTKSTSEFLKNWCCSGN